MWDEYAINTNSSHSQKASSRGKIDFDFPKFCCHAIGLNMVCQFIKAMLWERVEQTGDGYFVNAQHIHHAADDVGCFFECVV